MALDVSGDWAIFDWTQTVVYVPRVDDDTFETDVTWSVLALKRADEKKAKEGFSGTELAYHNCIWEIWEDTFAITSPDPPDPPPPNPIPKRGDKFVATNINGQQTWIVEGVDYCDETTRFRLACYQQGMGS